MTKVVRVRVSPTAPFIPIYNKINKNIPDEVKNLKIIYGGSVNAKNALQLFALESVDGGLIGRASLDVGEFASICKAATSITN